MRSVLLAAIVGCAFVGQACPQGDSETGPKSGWPGWKDPVASHAVFSADDRIVYVAFDQQTERSERTVPPGPLRHRFGLLFDTESGKRLASVPWSRSLGGMAPFRPKATEVILSAGVDTLERWDWKAGKSIGEFSPAYRDCTSVTYSQDGKTLFAGYEDNRVIAWDVDSRKQKYQCELTVSKNPSSRHWWSLFVSPDGKRLIGCSPDLVRVWEAETGKTVAPDFREHNKDESRANYQKFRCSPDGKWLAIVETHENFPEPARLYDLGTGKLSQRLWLPAPVPYFRVEDAAFSEDSAQFLTSDVEGFLTRWDVKSGKYLGRKQLPKTPFISSTGRFLLIPEDKASMRLWDIKNEKDVWTIRIDGAKEKTPKK